MAILTKGVDFTTGDQVSATNLDNLVDAAAFASGAVDNSTTQLSSGSIIVKDGGITSAKHASDATNANASRTIINRGTSALTDGASIATNCALSNVFTVTLGGNRTLANPTNMLAGATYIWLIKQDATGSRTLAYGSAFKFTAATAPTLSTTANTMDVLSAVSDGTSLFCGFVSDVR